jgi:hypothetical protein
MRWVVGWILQDMVRFLKVKSEQDAQDMQDKIEGSYPAHPVSSHDSGAMHLPGMAGE